MTSRSRALALALLDLMRAIREEVVAVDLRDGRPTTTHLTHARAGELMRVGHKEVRAREDLKARNNWWI